MLYSSMLTRSFKISLSIVYFQIMTTLASIRKKKAGTGNWDEAWRDNGILSEIGRDGGISEPGTGPSLQTVSCCHNVGYQYI